MTRDAVDVHGRVRPLLRGWSHLVAAVVALPAGVALVAHASGAEARAAAAVYALSLLALFTASSSYHLGLGGVRRTPALRRLDHSSIYLLIAGSYTPVCLVVLATSPGLPLLVALWVAAIAGVTMKLTRFDGSHRVGFALYLTMGWAAIIALPGLIDGVSSSSLWLLGLGGVVYTTGAIVLAARAPNLVPGVFGYHELWHVMVIVAAAMHYVVFWDVLAA
jgi:hemolysin III